jgi:hypothetical protein
MEPEPAPEPEPDPDALAALVERVDQIEIWLGSIGYPG